MSAAVLQVLRQLVREELLALRTAELGIVQEQHPADPDNYACTVRLRDSDIVLAKVPVATSRLGTVAIPPVGALVLVQFLGGDINAPIVVASLYNDEDRPPTSADGELVWNLPHAAAADEAVTLTVKTVNDKLAKLAIGTAVSVQIQESDPVLLIDVGGKASIKIASDGQVDVETSGTLNVKANELNLSADANLSIKAGGTLDLQGSVLNLN
jgi:phage baseplate assembly protein gpV